MSLKKITGILTALLTASAIAAGGTAFAEDAAEVVEREVLPKAVQYDEICGKVNVSILSDADIYVRIIKHTPETGESGYAVYDTVIKASDVYDDCVASMKLECNNYNIEEQEYDSYYDILVGVHKHIGSEDPEDILYREIEFTVTDKDLSGHDTNCEITVSLSDEDMEKPSISDSTDGNTKKYELVFPHIQMPTEPEPTEPEVIWGDANNDGNVNIRDAALIASKLASGKSDELTEAADYNRDGNVNIRDAAALASNLSKKQ